MAEKRNEDIPCESEAKQVIPMLTHEQSKAMMEPHSLLNFCFPPFKAESKFSVYL